MPTPFRFNRRKRVRSLSAAVRNVESLEGRKMFAAAVSPKPPSAAMAKSAMTPAKTVDLKHKSAKIAAAGSAPAARADAVASATLMAAPLLINNDSKTFATLADTTVTMTGKAELKITGSASPITGSTINLDSSDAWVFFTGLKPSVVNSTYLSQIKVNGVNAVHGTNVRVVQFEMGTVVIPHAPSYQPLTAYTGPNFTGASKSFSQYTYYNTGGSLGTMFKNVSSFKLKRGYMATVATAANGSGTSKVYIAQDGDIDVGIMPSGLDNQVQFVRVFPWRWVAKKGASDVSPTTLGASWNYNWDNNQASTLDNEYVPIRQQRWWPGLPTNQKDVTHLLGYNEPDNPVEDAYETLGNGNVDTAIAEWPGLMASGVRLGSPAVTDGGKSWLYSFMDKAIAANLRVDFIAIHNYQAGKTAASFKAWLQDIWDRYHKPIWVTEFNNGANWTGGADPTYQQNADAIGSFIDMFDTTPWIERYSIFSNVEDVRKVTYSDGSLTPMGTVYKNNASPVGYVQEAATSTNTSGRSVARLPLDGNTSDVSGYGNNGAASGAPAYTTGKSGQAMVFDGVDDSVRLADNVGRGTSGFSFAGWVNWDGGADWQRVFDFGTGTSQYAFLSASGGGKMRFAVKNGGAEQVVETSPLPVGTWTHVAVTLGSNTAKLYVNGTLAATNAGVTIKPADFAPTFNYFGKSQYAADPLFKGKIDEVLITDSALTAAQVSALLTNTAPQFTTAELSRGPVRAGTAFSGTLAGSATDADSGDTLTYAKANGPSWLTVATTGALIGTPPAGTAFPQEFVVTATDSRGATAFATLTLTEVRGVAQLAFDGTAADTGGFGNTPTLVGAPAYTAGRRGQALALTGTGQYVQMTDNVAHGDEFSFAAWVNWNGGAAWQRIFDFGNDTSSYLFLTPSNGTQMQANLTIGSSAFDLKTATMAVNTWTHVAVTIGAGTAKLYVNGTLAATATGVTAKPSDFRPTNNYLGKSQFAADPLFAGRLDDVNVSDTAYTPQQILALMNPNAAPTVQTAATALLATSKRANLSVLGADDGGEAALTYTWSAVGPAAVTFSANGTNGTNAAKAASATFAKAGAYVFTATITDPAGQTTTSVVNLNVPAVSTSVLVTPASGTVNAGQTLASTAVARDQFNTPLATQPAFEWAVEEGGGTITAAGVYTAPATGSGLVTISATGAGVTGVASFTVVGNAVAPTLVSAVSRRAHANGVFDLPLSLTTPTTDPRVGGPGTLVLTFSDAIQAVDGTLDASEFTITNAHFASATLSGVTLTLTLANVVNASDVTVALQGMAGITGTALAAGTAVTVRALAGDATGDGRVSFDDFALLQTTMGTTSAAFMPTDLNGSGTIDFDDFALLQVAMGTGMA